VAAGSGPERQRNHLDELLHAHTITLFGPARVQWRRRNEGGGEKPVSPENCGHPRFTTDLEVRRGGFVHRRERIGREARVIRM